MAPDNFNIRIQSLLHVHFSPQQRSLKHPFIQHFTATRINNRNNTTAIVTDGLLKVADGDDQENIPISGEQSNAIVKTKTGRTHRTSQYPLHDLRRVVKGMLTLKSTPKESSPTTINNPTSYTTITSTTNTVSSSSIIMAPRFQLPQLTPINISLTDGTNIPPPPPLESPLEEKKSPWSDSSHFESLVKPNTTLTPPITPNQCREEDEEDDEKSFQKISPCHVFPKQPRSFRKFFSRRRVDANYTTDSISTIEFSRPNSSLSQLSVNPSTRTGKKRIPSWLGRFNEGFNKKRASSLLPVNPNDGPRFTPPLGEDHLPPTLPQLNQLHTGSGLGGPDLFKNII